MCCAMNLSDIPTSKVVAGDVLQARAGEKIPVDGNGLQKVTLPLMKLCFTGESLPVEKQVGFLRLLVDYQFMVLNNGSKVTGSDNDVISSYQKS